MDGSPSGTPALPHRIDRRLLRIVGNRIAPARGRLRMRGCAEDAGFTGADGPPTATIVVNDRRTLFGLALNPGIAFGDGYAEGRIQVEGDLPAFIEGLFRASTPEPIAARLASQWQSWIRRNSLTGSRANIHHHYDLDVNFYKLWLDSRLVYTCAYFAEPSMSLEEAQVAKMDYVCRKIQLRRGESVVEAGCGWGSLALHMAREYGARVRAFNISAEQIAYAREQSQREGLDQQIEFVQDDYRNISGKYDAFVSIGMLEHVGKNHHSDLANVIQRSLNTSGRGLLHFIGRNHPQPLNAWIRKRIFPGAYPPALREVVELLEPVGVSVMDVENLRVHYAWTLEHWLDRFEKASRQVRQMFGDKFVRLWRMYLAGSLAGFRAGSMQLFQLLFAGADCKSIPATRDHLYVKETGEARETKWMHASA